MGNICAKLNAVFTFNKVKITPKMKTLMKEIKMERWMFQYLWEAFCKCDLDGNNGIDSQELCLWMERCHIMLMDDISALTAQYFEGFKCIANAVFWERNVLVPKMRMRYARPLTFEEFCGVLISLCVANEDDIVDIQYRAACRGTIEVDVRSLMASYKRLFSFCSLRERKAKEAKFAEFFGIFDQSRKVKKSELKEASLTKDLEWVVEPARAMIEILQKLTFGSKEKWKTVSVALHEKVDEKDEENSTLLRVLAKIISPKIRKKIVLGANGQQIIVDDEEEQAKIDAELDSEKKKKVKTSKVKAWQPKRFRKRKARKRFNDQGKAFEN